MTRSPGDAALVLALGVAVALAALSIDLIAPGLLAIRQDLAINAASAGLTVAAFMLGLAAGQPVFGWLSDRLGRRRMLRAGLVVFVAASFGCAASRSAAALLGWRIAQGFGAGASVVIAGAVIRDLFRGAQAHRIRSRVNLIYSLAPILAPALGSQIVRFGGWRLGFVLLGCCGGAVIIAAGLLPAQQDASAAPRRQTIAAPFVAVARHRPFIVPALVDALGFAAVFAIIATAPLVLIGADRVAPVVYGVLFACMAVGLSAVAAVETLLIATGAAGVAVFVLLSTLLLFTRGVVAVAAQHAAMEAIERSVGVGAALLGFTQVAAGTLSSAIAAALYAPLGSAAASGTAALFAAAALAVWRAGRRGGLVDGQ